MAEADRSTAEVVPLEKKQAKRRSCPICGKPATPESRPFCSKRCADIDLGRWLKEDYRVPVEEEAELSEDAYAEGRGED
jgi:endogenous inhibitor of DNA gyrase (YacG/DUF329 family)